MITQNSIMNCIYTMQHYISEGNLNKQNVQTELESICKIYLNTCKKISEDKDMIYNYYNANSDFKNKYSQYNRLFKHYFLDTQDKSVSIFAKTYHKKKITSLVYRYFKLARNEEKSTKIFPKYDYSLDNLYKIWLMEIAMLYSIGRPEPIHSIQLFVSFIKIIIDYFRPEEVIWEEIIWDGGMIINEFIKNTDYSEIDRIIQFLTKNDKTKDKFERQRTVTNGYLSKSKKINPNDIEELILKGYNQTQLKEELSIRYGVSTKTIQRLLQQLGKTRSYKKSV